MKKCLIFIAVCLFSFSLLFFGCNDTNYSAKQVDSLYNEILLNHADSLGFLNVYIEDDDIQQVSPVENDKNYIFDLFYEDYVSASGGLFFGVGQRQGKSIEYALKNFTNEELNQVYSKLIVVRDCLNVFNDVKYVYQSSYGNMYYEEVILQYNKIIVALNDLNDVFSNYYLQDYYSNFQYQNNVSDGVVKDVIWYGFSLLSKTVYKYDVENFTFSNPYGEVNSWYNNTLILKNYINLYNSVVTKLKKTDITDNIFYKEQILEVLKSLLNDSNNYNKSYELFLKAINNVSLKEYLQQPNKEIYFETISNLEISYLNYIDNFILNRYSSMFNGLSTICGLV